MRDSVLFAEVSLRRNYQDLTFCPQNNREDLAQSYHRSITALGKIYPDYHLFDDKALTDDELPFESTVFLPPAYDQLVQTALFVDKASGFSAAINMDEHLVLKQSGSQRDLAAQVTVLRKTEAALSQEGHPFAFDEQYGFLSYRPVLAGSGLHVRLVLHLPMLHFLKQLRPITEALKAKGCGITPLTTKGGRNPARLYILSNNSSFKLSDDQIVSQVLACAEMLADKEAAILGKALAQNEQSTIADQVWRAYGLLKYARRLTASDFLIHWNSLRIGAQEGIVPLTTTQADGLMRFANDYAFQTEGADPKTFVFRRADAVRRVLSGG
ncbi:MAG: hypothetical protein GXZ04_03980 [Clostridiales bacterium]|nr:hypothetical protein [Clostridiales bacterium]